MVGTRHLDVRIGEVARPVGTLIYENDGRREHSVFTYDPDWLQSRDAFALSPALPLSGFTFHTARRGERSGIPAVMMDGAPDSWGRAIIKRRSRGRHCDDFDYLTEVDDYLRTGALRYFNEDGEPLAAPREQRIPRFSEIPALNVASRRFEDDPEAFRELRDEFMGALGSLGGARPKVNVADRDGVLWIAKLASTGDALPVARGEVLALQLASACGIRAAEAQLLPGARRYPVALIRRFDRSGERRIPFMSAQTMLAIDGAEPSDYVSIADAIRGHGEEPAVDMAELYGRLLFTILVSNFDDHLRNHAFLHVSGGRWRLSPAYDINPKPGGGGLLQTGISEVHGFEPDIEAAIDAAPFFDVSVDAAAARAKAMASYIRDNWRGLGERLGLTPEEIRRYAGAFEHRSADIALSWSGLDRVSEPAYP